MEFYSVQIIFGFGTHMDETRVFFGRTWMKLGIRRLFDFYFFLYA